jgi:hypothetical protein
MPPLPSFPEDASVGEALAQLAAAGWREIGAGDWSRALEDPSGGRVARVTGFDPAYRMFAEECLAGPRNRWLPRFEAILPLRRDGYVAVMERLWPADRAAAAAFCRALGAVNDSRETEGEAGLFSFADDVDLAALSGRLRALLASGASRYRLWGGADIRPANVMTDADGALKLIDPVFIAGKDICAALRDGRADLLADFTPDQLEDFLGNPFLAPGGVAYASRDEVWGWFGRMYGRKADDAIQDRRSTSAFGKVTGSAIGA